MYTNPHRVALKVSYSKVLSLPQFRDQRIVFSRYQAYSHQLVILVAIPGLVWQLIPTRAKWRSSPNACYGVLGKVLDSVSIVREAIFRQLTAIPLMTFEVHSFVSCRLTRE